MAEKRTRMVVTMKQKLQVIKRMDKGESAKHIASEIGKNAVVTLKRVKV